MTRSHSGLAFALREIFRELPEQLEYLPAALQEIFWNTVAPIAVIFVVLGITALIAKRIKRILYPPSSLELHKEALLALQTYRSVKQRKAAQKQAETLLRQAINQDPSYLPAILSLAAMYIYRQQNANAAIQLLLMHETNTSNVDNNDDVKSLLLDAQAMQAGQGNMIQTELRDYEFLSLSYYCAANKTLNTSSSSAVMYDADDSKKKQ